MVSLEKETNNDILLGLNDWLVYLLICLFIDLFSYVKSYEKNEIK